MRCVEEDQTLGSLTPCATSDGKIIVLPWRKHHEEIARLVGAAFAGTEKTAPERPCSWCVGPKFATIGDPARDRMVSFCMTLYLCVKGPKSTILSVRDGNSIVAVAIVQKLKRVPPPTTFMDGVRIFGTVVSLLARWRMPRGATALQKRGDIIDQEFHKLHTAACVGPHIYLAIIATAPAQQGKGYGVERSCAPSIAWPTRKGCPPTSRLARITAASTSILVMRSWGERSSTAAIAAMRRVSGRPARCSGWCDSL